MIMSSRRCKLRFYNYVEMNYVACKLQLLLLALIQIPLQLSRNSSSVLRGKINGDRNRIFVDNHPVYIIDNRMGFAPNNSPREYDYSEREEVLFELRERTNPKTGKPISFAINVRPAND